MAFKVDAVVEHYHAFNCKKLFINFSHCSHGRISKGIGDFKKVGRAKEALNPFLKKGSKLSDFLPFVEGAIDFSSQLTTKSK